jgi:DNA gyrase subunit A
MNLERPDLSQASPAVRAYVEALEAELAAHRRAGPRAAEAGTVEPAEPGEPPTTCQVITVTAGGQIKRTPRHLYERQRRGGMGVFDLDGPEGDPPALLAIADLAQNLILVTSRGRAFPLPVGQLVEAPVRSRGESLRQRLPLLVDEQVALLMPDMGAGYLNLVTRRGQVRRWRYNVFGRSLAPGTLLYDIREGGAPAGACWTAGGGELFIATERGDAIRFAEALVPVRGCLGIRCAPDDPVVGIAGVQEAGGVVLIGSDGRGSVRLMAGFSQNKAPGAGGKQAIKTDRLVGLGAWNGESDIFIVSRLGKIIRFRADEIPAKEGVVQGVACMALRGDETAAVAIAIL